MTHTISVWWIVRGLLGSAADSVPAASATVSGSSSRTYPRSGRSTCSVNEGTRESCIALERVVTFDLPRSSRQRTSSFVTLLDVKSFTQSSKQF